MDCFWLRRSTHPRSNGEVRRDQALLLVPGRQIGPLRFARNGVAEELFHEATLTAEGFILRVGSAVGTNTGGR